MRVLSTSAELICVEASRKSKPSIMQSGFFLFAVSADARAFDITLAIDRSLLSTIECRVPVVDNEDSNFVLPVNSFVNPSM